ncbi:conjugative transposon TraN protein [Dyadobacter sp. BE34]|uniref:Conjugative transposon TraN protein n=1 Tax=Dyadobacter fermentans TaxID=94254 RepID=A0ABU1R8F3_9BACT|nr:MULTISPECIES: conjugative transposon protein TraN [Dyadobacter]MDR6809684.1 conjugative transposon TraN protein [Dyadobacter fermentans]MDR7047362.1 conjugative transposon TraN protein [Dyadobacter sp. BE242]MDR7201597.1 conjugative transposon TraN protein [Dyadobacter sp. BE34]MDR7219467.1 conjugative transposon TraN protein [Dyadobacter sp. BE31]MDR7267138.1 conjugative transposon TraN protein [Dyadobacter sp. BE32]
MKSNKAYYPIICSLLAALFFTQPAPAQPIQFFAIESHPVEISAERTVAVIFPFSITSVDRGSTQILAQKAKGTQNVLLLKAAQKDIPPTSLIVITSDGAIYSFEVSYRKEPSSLILLSNPASSRSAKSVSGIDERQISEAIDLASRHPTNLKKRSSGGGVSAVLEGLFISEQLMLLRVSLDNKSAIDYEVESVRMFVADRRQVKRTASQHSEILPVKMSVELSQVKGSEQRSLVIAIPKMTLPRAKQFTIEVHEKGGARHLRIKLNARQLRGVSAL